MDLLTLALIGLVGGLITGISPCILPVLPVVFFAGGVEGARGTTDRAGPGTDATRARAGVRSARDGAHRRPCRARRLRGASRSASASRDRRRVGGRRRDPSDRPPTRRRTTGRRDRVAARRPYLVIAGLVTSFTLVTLVGTVLLNLLGLPQDLLRWAGIAVLALLGLGLLVPAVRGGPGATVPAADPEAGARARPRRLRARASASVRCTCRAPGPVLAAITVAGATGPSVRARSS